MAPFALLAWPLVALVIFLAKGPVHGLIWAVLIGHLTLPEAIDLDLPGLPPYNKGMAIALGCVLGAFVTRKRERVAFSRERGPTVIMAVLLTVFVLSPLFTVFNNGQNLYYGPTVVPGLGIRDGIAMISNSMVFVVMFLMARRYLFTEAAHRALLRAIVLAGVAYSFLILFELRMSPQLHIWVYGYFQHSWVQHVRGGGFRPIVFLQHGLWVGFLLYMTVIAAVALLRKDKSDPVRLEYLLMGGWLLLVLLISRNLGAAFLAVLFVPAMLFLPRRVLIWIGMVVSVVFLALPIMRQVELLPTGQIVTLAEKISPARAASLEYRFDNEDAFLARAAEKPLAGWGIWARWRIWDENSGSEVATSDGMWVSRLGERGWLGYLSMFGLLTMPIFFLRRTERTRGITVSMATAGLVIIVAGNLIYLIPNNTLSPLSLLVAGGLAGFVQKRTAREAGEAEDEDADAEASVLRRPGRRVRYSRFAPGEREGRLRRPTRPA